MTRRVLMWVLVAAVMIALPPPALAFVPRAGDTVLVSEPIQDDLYAAGGTVTVSGAIDGDVVAAGGTVALTSAVTGGVLAAGGTVRIGGRIDRNLRAAGGTLELDGTLATDAVLAGGTVLVARTARIGRDLVAAGGTIRVAGAVSRNAWLSGGTVVIAGPVQGDVEVQADRVVLLSSARIGGRLRYGASRPVVIQSGAQVSGGVERVPYTGRRRWTPVPVARAPFVWFWRLMEGVWLLALGVVVFAFLPRSAANVVGEVRTRFGSSLLTGFVLLVVVPVAAVLLLITVLGFPLSGVLMLLYALTLYPAQIFVAAWLGEEFVRAFQREPESRLSPYAALAVGTVGLMILFALPFAGWALRLLAMLTGFGAVWVTTWRATTSRQASAGGGS